MKTWYQVELPDRTVFGFSVNQDKYIIDHPEWSWKHRPLVEYKPTLLQLKAKVYEICIQYQ